MPRVKQPSDATLLWKAPGLSISIKDRFPRLNEDISCNAARRFTPNLGALWRQSFQLRYLLLEGKWLWEQGDEALQRTVEQVVHLQNLPIYASRGQG